MNIAIFGSSLLSAYWNGAATYYRGIVRALAENGHRITFYEPDAYDRQKHCDIAPPAWVKSVVYENSPTAALRQVEHAAQADLLIKASGVGVFDELLEAAVLAWRRPGSGVAFWDVDAPATLARVHSDPKDQFRELIPHYDIIFTYGGGEPVVRAYAALGAKLCVPIYNGLDPEIHHPVQRSSRFSSDLSFLGNRLPDREARVEEFFIRAAESVPSGEFLLGGSGWGDKPFPANVRYKDHIYTVDHNAFNCSARCVLNISRLSMAQYGFSPATRVFEAAGAGACLITDAWEGIENFFEPGREILIASSGVVVADLVQSLSPCDASRIGQAALKRALAEHTYQMRAAEFDRVMAVA